MKSIILKVILFTVIFSSVSSYAIAEVYRWKDESGQIVFGDKPPKDKSSTEVSIEDTINSGTQFASPEQVRSIKTEAARQQNSQPRVKPVKRVDSYCRRYISELNKVEIFLEHTNSPKDQQKARDLRKLIKIECNNDIAKQKFNDSYCRRYREELQKTEIFLEHTKTRRDQNKVIGLRKQIERECR